MIKGVNRQVVEVCEPDSIYFEKILFFVKPEYYGLGESKLREKAGAAVKAELLPPRTRKKGCRSRFGVVVLSAGAGAAVSAAVSLFLYYF